MIKLRPLADRVFVKQHDIQEQSEGGIVLAGGKDKPLMGTVIEAGPGYWLWYWVWLMSVFSFMPADSVPVLPTRLAPI